MVVLLTATGGGTAFGWEQATYVDATGRQFPIDTANSQFPGYVEDGGIDLAHVSFAGAQHGGQLIDPVHGQCHGSRDHDPHPRHPAMRRRSPMRSMIAVAAVAAVSFLGAPTTDAGTSEFEPVDFFTDLFTWIGDDPPNRGDLDQRVAPGSPASRPRRLPVRVRDGPPRQPARSLRALHRHRERPPRSPASKPSTSAAKGSATSSAASSSTTMAGCRPSCSTASPSTTGWPCRRSRRTSGSVSIGVVGAFERVTVDELAVVLAIDPEG